MNQDRQKSVALAFAALLLVLWLGFLVHRSPAFPRSSWGLTLGIVGGALMVVSAAYVFVKRVALIKQEVSRRHMAAQLLSFHVFAGLIGAIVAILHTGHRFQSPLAMWLTGSMLLLVATGIIGRYLYGYTVRELREKRELLSQLQQEFDGTATEIAATPELLGSLAKRSVWGRATNFVLVKLGYGFADPSLRRAVLLAEAIADVDYSVKSHDVLKRAFTRWLWAHIVLAAVFLLLLGVHIWSGLYYSLRWFQ